MTERDDEPKSDEAEVTIEENRLVGCRGRVLIALVVLTVLLALLVATLVRGMLTGTPQLPVKRAAAESVAAA